MQPFLAKFKIHTKLLAGFAVLLAILLLSSSLIRIKLFAVKDEIDAVLNQHRPIEQQVLILDAALDDTVAALGLFVSLHDETSARRYEEHLRNAVAITDTLQRSEVIFQTAAYADKLEEIRGLIDQLTQYGDQLLETNDEEINFPGLAYANDHLNPLTREIQQLTTQMLHTSTALDHEDSHELLLLKSDLRYYWVNVMSGVRAYLAYRSDRIVHDNRLFLDAVKQTLQKIGSDEYVLDLEDEAAFTQLNNAVTRFENSWVELQTIQNSNQWRTDSYLIRTRISPLFDQIESELEEFIQLQQSTMDSISGELLAHSNQITNLADIFLLLGMITGITMAMLMSRVISRPIYKIANAMENIASSDADLTQRLDASGKDELSLLARSFNTFTLKAQHRSEEERALSNLLRQSLKPTDLDTYLGDALTSVIQTVTWLTFEPKGGIFLKHPDDDNTLKLTATHNFSPEITKLCSSVRYGQCLCGRVAENRKIEFASDVDDRHDIHFHGMQPHGHYSVPIQSGDILLGVLVLYLRAGHKRSSIEEAFLSNVAEVLSMGISLRQANDELMVAKHRAEAFGDQLTNITANIPGIIYQCRRTHAGACHYPFVSPGTAALLGKDMDDPQGDIHSLFTAVNDLDRERLESTLNASSLNLSPINIEYRINQQGGGVRWILCNALPRETHDSQTLWDGILLDITDRKNLERKLLQAQKLESVGQLAAGIAHEINTPTQYVQDNTRFLQEAYEDYMEVFSVHQQLLDKLRESSVPQSWLKPIDDTVERIDIEYLNEEIPQAFQQTLDGINRISTIVSAMKEFSHPGTEDKQPMNINDVIENVSTISRNEWKYVAELELNLAADLPSPIGYRDKIGQVILNLIVNAAHAIGDQIEAGKYNKGVIKVTTESRGDKLEICISDNGPGIPPAIQEKIFDPFFTTKEVGKGTGQGLSIAHSVIVELHQGTLWVESKPDQGARFIIQIPLEAHDITMAANG